jgi:hypothetical protein
MKKLLIGSLLSITVISGLVSCQSTKYDADPKTDLSYAVNPLDTANHTVMISSMKGKVNGAWMVLSPAYFKVDTNGNRNIHASVANDSVYFRMFDMTLPDGDVKNKDDMKITNYTMNYGFYDTTIKKRREYTAKGGTSTATNIQLNLIEDKDGGMRGYFNGKISLTLPEPGNPSDVVTFDSMYFYFDKRK